MRSPHPPAPHTQRAWPGVRQPPLAPARASPRDDAGPPSPLDPAAVVSYGGTLPSRRRLLLGGSAAAAAGLGGNLGGVTSALLGSAPAVTSAARAARLDVVFPILGRKRAWSADDGFEFTYPSPWLADATVARREAQRRERLDPLMQPRRGRSVAEPVLAFGPAGSTGETNVSVVVAPIEPGFDLAQLGAPAEAAAKFLETVAPPDSGRKAELLTSSSRTDASGTLYYQWSYRVTGASFDRTNWSALAARAARVRGGRPLPPQLVTLNAQAPTVDVERDGGLAAALAECAASFRIER